MLSGRWKGTLAAQSQRASQKEADKMPPVDAAVGGEYLEPANPVSRVFSQSSAPSLYSTRREISH